VINKITPADISDPQEVIARAKALSVELGTPIAPGFEALVFKASRGIEDIYELNYIRKDGSRFPAVVSVTALRDAHEAIIGYLLIGTDNTARKQVEQEREKLDQRLRDQQFYTRSLIESNIDAIMTTDPQGIITDVNNQMEALTGCTRDELIGAPFKNCFTDLDRAEAAIKQVLSEKKVVNYELTARARDGKETVVSYNAATFYDRDRSLQGVIAAARDVTERKRIETAQRQSEKRYRTLFELGPVGVYSCDAEGAIREFNARAAELWGRKPKSGDAADVYCGSHKLYHLNGSFMPHDQCPMADVLGGKMPSACDREVVIERPDGSRVLVLENIAPLRDERGAITGAINCFVDLTALKQAMEAQSRLDTLTVTNRELEREIARRQVVEKSLQSSELHLSQSLDKSRHLAHQILSAQEEERKEISQELHDEVAQSLAAIGVHLSALGAEALRNPKGLAKKVALTQELVKKSMHTVHRFARELRPAILDDLGLVAALHSFLKEFEQRTGLQVHFTAFTTGKIDRLDSKKSAVLYRVAQSALNNSAKHAKGSLVNVSLQKIPGAICMEIKDNGKGFQVERVLHAKRHKRLGLPIMKERVDMAGGSFAVESIRGQGTTIRVQIPVDDGAHQI